VATNYPHSLHVVHDRALACRFRHTTLFLSTLAVTDPELIGVFDNFVFDEVL
jgi:hypothetical protein